MRYTNGYPNLSLAVILNSITNNGGDCDCSTFMSAIEWNINENPKSLNCLAKQFKCNPDPITVIIALHDNLFDGLGYIAGQYNSYTILTEQELEWWTIERNMKWYNDIHSVIN